MLFVAAHHCSDTGELKIRILWRCTLAVQNGSGHSEHQQHIGELEKELGRLRQDGQAYREDLLHQLEAAKQAATQARYEAGQSNARASYEASQVQQLQDDKTRTADIEDNWKQQAREQQVGHEFDHHIVVLSASFVLARTDLARGHADVKPVCVVNKLCCKAVSMIVSAGRDRWQV